MKKANIVCAIIGMIFSLITFSYTFTFKQFPNVPVGPEFFPRALSVVLFICCTALFISSILHKETEAEKKKGSPTISPLNKDIQKALLGLFTIIIYALLWEKVGFLIVTPFAIFIMIRILGKKDYLKMAIISVIATIIIFFAFKILLGIEMPMGIIEEIQYMFESEDEIEEFIETSEVSFNFVKNIVEVI